MDNQAGISPLPPEFKIANPGLGEVGAVAGQVDEEDFEDLVAGGAFEEAEVEQDNIEESQAVEGPESKDGDEGKEAKERRAPTKPSPEEVAKHDLTHIPRRMWCKVCAEADLQEDPHVKSRVDHKDDGIPQVHMDYKELHKGKRPFLVLRERATGATFGMRCMQKGPGDEWAVKRCVEKIEQWGLARVRLTVRSDGEPAIKSLREAIKQARKSETLYGTSPPRDPQSNGVAERAVK